MLSVIVAVYNVEKYIDKTIHSIMQQTFSDLEIILVDDGSTDNSGLICDRLANEDLRIKVIHKANGGLSDARNVGIDNSHGEYLAFVDGDDFIHPDMYEKLMMNLVNTKSDISACEFVRVKDGENAEVSIFNEKLEILSGYEALNQLNRLVITVAWNKVYKKELFHELRYPKGRLHEDEFIIHHLLDRCEKIVLSNCELYFYLVRSGSIMNSMNLNRISDIIAALEDRYLFFERKSDRYLCEQTGNDMINTLIMYDKEAVEKRDINKEKIEQIVSINLKNILDKSQYIFSRESEYEAKLFLLSPQICFWTRRYKDICNRVNNKFVRLVNKKELLR